MKLASFIKHLNNHDCSLLREGSKHSVWINNTTRKQSTVPRHKELSDLMCDIISRQLGISKPR